MQQTNFKVNIIFKNISFKIIIFTLLFRLQLITQKVHLIVVMKKTVLALPFFILAFLPSLISNKQNYNVKYKTIPQVSVVNQETIWVDSVMKSLSTDEKIAQLIMIRTLSNKDSVYYNEISDTIKKYNIGGICFFQGGPVKEAQLTNRWQHEAKTPLLIAIDGEWGLNMRLDSTIAFPRQMTLGAIQNDRMIYEMGVEIARQCKRLGINMNFAPVIDINSNPKNPVINTRSFGENKYNVSAKGLAYMKGLQDNGIIAVGKHFPGHGDADKDSHYTLPVIKHSKECLDTLELYPFRELISNGLMAIMVAHLNIPAYVSNTAVPSTLSDTIINYLLKIKLAFNGLVITDALDMKGVSNYFNPGIIEVSALKAGNDILLLPHEVDIAVNAIKVAIARGDIAESLIDEKCRKILSYKYKAGLNNFHPVVIDKVYEDLNTESANKLNKELIRAAITLVKNENNTIPFSAKPEGKTASLVIGDNKTNDFQNALQPLFNQTNFSISKEFNQSEADAIFNKLSGYDRIFLSVHNTNSLPQKKFGITTQTINLIKRIKKTKKIILCLFGNPYVLSFFDNTDNIDALIISYQDDKNAQEATADIIMGKAEAQGKLPVTGSADFPVNTGILTGAFKYLKYEEPAQIGISEKYIRKIDSIAQMGIKAGAYPGCQILFAKDGKVFYHKSFGYHTYDSLIKVHNTDLYDIASVTKIVATTLAVMKLYDENKIDLNEKLSTYLPYLEGSNKANLKIFDILGHQARLKSWIPFYTKTIIKGKLDSTVYSNKYSKDFPLKVADNIYINKYYHDSIMKQIIESPLNNTCDYLYSDLGYYFLREIIEKITGQSIDNYVYDNFYKPMGLYNTVYNPREYFSPDVIIPTEVDKTFRKQTLVGYVNDQGAAMRGGVAGHAGIFSNSWELAVIMQMFLNEGRLGDKQYIKASTVNLFTKRHFTYNNNNRRGLAFDKPLLKPEATGPTCKDASQNSFGHSGFTGTYVWADPDYKLVYIFLSNRTYPDPENRKISTLNIRTDIHQIVYDAIKNSKTK